jgi:hypothetical protein
MTWDELIGHPSIENVGRGWAEGRWRRWRFVIRQGKSGDHVFVVVELIVCRAADAPAGPGGAWLVGAPAIVKGSCVLRHAILADGLSRAAVDAYLDALADTAERMRPRRSRVSAAPVFTHFAL